MKSLVLALSLLLSPVSFYSVAHAEAQALVEGWTVEGFDGATNSHSATMIWRTRVPTNGVLSVGLTPTDFSFREVRLTDLETSHLVVVDDLAPNTRYYFTVLATDEDGVNVASEIISKKTKAP